LKTNIIIFSSKEELRFVETLQEKFYHRNFAVEVWSNGFFGLSKSYIENFSSLKLHYDYALVILSDDDCVLRNGEKIFIPRDNVLLELGMCIEAFSLSRTIIVKKDKVHLPSDLSGIQTIEYSVGANENLDAITGTIAAKVNNYIEHVSLDNQTLSWDELFTYTKAVIDKLRKSESMGGFYFDVLVGINRGGLIIADLISREFGQNKPILSLFADRRNGSPVFDDQDFIINNSDIVKMLENKSIRNILVVDSFTRSGNSVVEARHYLTKHLPDKRIKSAVVYVNTRLKDTECLKYIDYFAEFKELDGKHLSLDGFKHKL